MNDTKTVWLVIESDYDNSYVRAAYESEGLARHHATEMGLYCESIEISHQLPSEVTDPAAIQARKEALALEAAQWKQRQQIEEQQWIRRQETTIADFSNPGLCHCQTFSEKPTWNAHGYCTYCGGFSPIVFRQARGEEKLAEYIAKLSEWDRNKMNAICGLAPER